MAQFLKEEVKAKIKVSAVKIFSERGYQKSSIKAIADHAGVSVGNVYRYYKNKEVLYESVLEGFILGIQDVMTFVDVSKNYEKLYNNEHLGESLYIPMRKFIDLYRLEEDVIMMLINGGKDEHYNRTMTEFISMLRNYFIRFWGEFSDVGDMTYVEASAFTNAIVAAVIDILQNVKGEDLDEVLMDFVTKMIRGYFYMRGEVR